MRRLHIRVKLIMMSHSNSYSFFIQYFLWNISNTKDELGQEGIFFLNHLFARDVLVMNKLEIEKTKPTFIIPVLKVEY